jgi:hypothetical protein
MPCISNAAAYLAILHTTASQTKELLLASVLPLVAPNKQHADNHALLQVFAAVPKHRCLLERLRIGAAAADRLPGALIS